MAEERNARNTPPAFFNIDVVPSTSGALSQDASSAPLDLSCSEEVWADVLKDLYEKTIGKPPSPQPTNVADEEQPPRYSTIVGGSYQAVQETNQAGTSHDNASGELQLWPIVTPEQGEAMFTMQGRSHYTAQPAAVSTETQQQRARETSDGTFEESWIQLPCLYILPSYENIGNGSIGVHLPKSGSVEEAFPSTSGGDMAGFFVTDMKDATGSTQSEKRKNINGVYGDVNHGMKSSRNQRHKCEICDRLFKRRNHLVVHRRTHTGEKPYHCDACDKSFARKDSLVTHHLTHTGEKPYHCNVCDKSFALKGILVVHHRTHKSEKPFKCKICTKSFAQAGNLRAHERTHTGEKPYHCDACDKSFARKGSLVLHHRTHTGEKPYHCNICETSFALKGNLVVHLRTHTGYKP